MRGWKAGIQRPQAEREIIEDEDDDDDEDDGGREEKEQEFLPVAKAAPPRTRLSFPLCPPCDTYFAWEGMRGWKAGIQRPQAEREIIEDEDDDEDQDDWGREGKKQEFLPVAKAAAP